MYQNNKLRHELKYFITYDNYIYLKTLLKRVLKSDQNTDQDGNYHIRSMYFDDMYESALYEKKCGIFQREKFRIRIYNFSSKKIKLESKRKFGEFISKRAASITEEEYYKIMNNDYGFLEGKTGVLGDFYRKCLDVALRPRVIVDYLREPYILDIGEVRITFDKNLSAGFNSNNIFDKNLANVSVYGNDSMILEVKFNEFIPGYVSSILGTTSLKQLAASKYVMCRGIKNNIYL